MPGYVYILRNEKGNFYIGSSPDIDKRLKQHFQGHTRTTYNRKIDCLVFQQEFATLSEARQVERRPKNLKRKDYIEKIIQDGYIKLVKKQPL